MPPHSLALCASKKTKLTCRLEVRNRFLQYHALRTSSKLQKYLAVWALNLDWIIHDAFPDDDKKKMSVYVVTAPRASNPYLHAQGGVFTTEILTEKEQKSRRRPDIKTVDKIVEYKWNSLGFSDPVMAHITLPWREAAKLLRLLNREGVNSATLFPGYQGIADSLKNRAYWDKKDRTLYWLPN